MSMAATRKPAARISGWRCDRLANWPLQYGHQSPRKKTRSTPASRWSASRQGSRAWSSRVKSGMAMALGL